MSKQLAIVAALAIVFAVTSAVAVGPVGNCPQSGHDVQNTCMVQSGSTYESTKYQEWHTDLPAGVWVTPLLDEADNVYVTTNDNVGTYVKLDSDGNLLWSVGTGASWGTDGQGCLGQVGEDVFWYVPVQLDGPGQVWKIDTATGNIIWSVAIPAKDGREPELTSTRMKIDADGDLYLHAGMSGYAYKVTDLGASGSVVWETYTGFQPEWGPSEIALSPAEDRVYALSNYARAITPADRQKLFSLDASTGAIVWSVAWGDQTTAPGFDFIGGFPVVDDAGDIYFNVDNNDGVPNIQGIIKYNSAGVQQWQSDTSLGWYQTWGIGQCGVSFNAAQTRVYLMPQEPGTLSLDTTTGQIQWTLTYSGGNTPGGYPMIGPTGAVYHGGLHWGAVVHRVTDNVTYGTWNWVDYAVSAPYAGPGYRWGSYRGGPVMGADGSLYSGTIENFDLPSIGGGVVKLYTEAPPLAIVWPQILTTLEKNIPMYGEVPFGLGWKLDTKGAQGPVTFSIVSGAPPGIYISAGGYLRGAATATGVYTMTVRADDTVVTADRVYEVTVVEPALQLGPGLPLASVGTPYGGALWIIGGTGPYTVVVTNGKADGLAGGVLGTTGLTMAADGSISGTPAAIGSATVEVTITDNAAASITKDITVDVVDSRVWDHFGRTKRRVGTSTLPAPVSFPHNLTVEREFQYKSEDTWQWCYEMMHAPTFALRNADADGDGHDDGYMFISAKFASYPKDAAFNMGWGDKIWTCAPYDVDPGGRYPGPHDFGGWYYNMNDDGWPGVHAPDARPALLRIDSGDPLHADRVYFTNDNQNTQGVMGCLDADTGALLWSIWGDSDSAPNIDRKGYMAMLDNGDFVTKTGQIEGWHCQPDNLNPGVWGAASRAAWYMGEWGDTYAIYRDNDTDGEIIWSAGEENNSTRNNVGPIFYTPGGVYWVFNSGYRGALSVFELADEGELVLCQAGGVNPYIAWASQYTLRADSVQNVTVWSVGCSDIPAGQWWANWIYWGTSPRACPVIDSTNNVYATMDRRHNEGSAAYRNPGIWAVDAADAADNPTVGVGANEWWKINSDASIKWHTILADADLQRVPATPALSYDQRTLYTVAVSRATGFGGDFWKPVPLNPGVPNQLIALNTINGSVKWIKDLEISGRSGADWTDDGDVDRHAFSPMTDPDGKVLISTFGDNRKWWDPPGSAQNPQDPVYDLYLRPMAWCFKDTGDGATLLWTRATSAEQYRDRAGPASFAVTPNYRLVFAACLDPEWIGVDPGWTAGNNWWQDGVRLIHPDDIHITDVYWSQGASEVRVTFTTQVGINYTIETADADAYDDGLPWSDWTNVTAAATEETVADNLTSRPLGATMRFYRVRRTDSDPFYSDETVGVLEIPIDAGATSLYFIGTPFLPDPDHNTVQAVFGAGANRQINRNSVTVSDLVETNGSINRMREAGATYSVLAGSAFNIEPAVGYELYPGIGFLTQFTLRLTGYVPEVGLTLPLTKQNNIADRWMAYSMPRTILLSQLGLQTSVTPFWSPSNKVRVLPLSSPGWTTCTYDSGTDTWTPNPNLVPGMGIHFIRAGFDNLVDQLTYGPWYFHPPNAW